MDLNKLVDLAPSLRRAGLLNTTDKGKFYQTTHNQYTVDLHQDKDAGYRTQPLYGSFPWDDDVSFSFKNASGNEEFKIKFNLHSEGHGGGVSKSLNLFINNSLASNEIKEKLLEKIDFNNFVDNELTKAKNQISLNDANDKQQRIDNELKFNQEIKEVISKLSKNEQKPKIDINELKQKIDQLSINTDWNLVSESGRLLFRYYEDGLEGDIKIHEEKFGNFDVTYKEAVK